MAKDTYADLVFVCPSKGYGKVHLADEHYNFTVCGRAVPEDWVVAHNSEPLCQWCLQTFKSASYIPPGPR